MDSDADIHWDMPYRPPSVAAQHSASFSASPELEYPSPVTSVSSYASPHALSHSDMSSLPYSQVPSLVGPSRVLTRRQRASLDQSGRRSEMGFSTLNTSDQLHSPSGSFFDSPRPEASASPHSPRQRLSDSLLGPPSMLSPYPPTPESSSSTPYSSTGYYDPTRNATSPHSHDRSASPALSTVTTASEHSVTSNTQTFASFPPPLDARKPKQRKQRLFNLDRRAICEYHRDYPAARQEDIAVKYGVERSTISKILKHKTKWLNVPANEDMRIAKHRPSKFPIIEDKMVEWLAEASASKIQLSDLRLREKAREIAKSMGLTEDRFKASSGWVENFKHRHGIRGGVWTGFGAKGGARKARAMGVGTLDTQEAFLSIMPPDYNDYPMPSEMAPVEPTAIRMQSPWEPERMPSSSSHEQHGDIPAPSPLDHVPHHSSEHLPSISPSHMLEEHPHSPLDQLLDDQRRRSPLEHHSPHALEHTAMDQHSVHTPLEPKTEYPASSDGLLPAIYHDGTLVYQHPVDEAASIPTLPEAEDYLNRLLLFFDTPGGEGTDLLNTEQRDALGAIRTIMFNAASGIRPH